ncbi:immunoglobulin superfamily containing leucine-rich repeat protein 2 [Microplitis demolitor]|uniref:immunoglobulin superfamily containing leucine-rich repeat protein 2 n=1 Tax=Microplitis demolitor TaxID=69319 RepID=UPI0004CCA4B9|nr:immunoglobulin superfamily containing leucine-rich repeat protein 2 [Microplitis demolitor]XP_008561157.1 immunoglobulin superfamily containing leucine-rich repeat protein 2 [Microplitis demolitor]XP_008561158.1 immunoglobulin superfamily containing leucine-rich repeat protein 2 [Microplitis demolitor]XP_008561159.1 immunoglobulin superfamily containing leucine-rich repeat protein 2 [Microplitis demolitor]XP_053594104.1 immunoglobulin superfamily containing leucine-rich repeat protein 2 [Mic
MVVIMSSLIYIYFVLTTSLISAAPDNSGSFIGSGTNAIYFTERDPSVRKCRHSKVYGMVQAMCADLNLQQIPPNLQSNIQVLEFSGNRLRELTNNTLLSYTSLSYVYFVDNFIRNIEDGAFMKLRNLQVLDLTTNAITDFPKNILSLPQLRSLYLSDNKLKDDALVPISSIEDSNIEILDLSRNLLNKLPPARALTQLKELNVSGNSISFIKASEIAAFCSLKTLDISHNPVVSIDNCECQEINAWIKFNKIKMIPPKVSCSSSDIPTESAKCILTTPSPERLISNETMQVYNNCKNNIVMREQLIKARNTWIIASSCIGVIIIITLVALYLIRRRNKKRKFRNVTNNLAATHNVNDELLNGNSINEKK